MGSSDRHLGGQEYDSQARREGEMVHENMSKHANLPTEVIMREYPMSEYADFPHLDDTIRGIDGRMKQDKGGMRKGMGKDIKY